MSTEKTDVYAEYKKSKEWAELTELAKKMNDRADALGFSSMVQLGRGSITSYAENDNFCPDSCVKLVVTLVHRLAKNLEEQEGKPLSVCCDSILESVANLLEHAKRTAVMIEEKGKK